MKARDWFTAMEKMVSTRMCMGFVLMLIGLLTPAVQYAAGGVIAKGTVMVSTGSGLVTEYDQTGTNLGQIDTTTGSFNTTGSEFDSAGNFFVTDFQAQQVTKFDPTGALIGSFGSGYNSDPESVFFDAAGNVYVGQADGTHNVLEFDPSGTLLNTFSPATEDRGTDWVEIAADQCTLFYTSEGLLVKRFNVCTNTQLTDFNTAPLPGTNAYAHKLLPSGGILVADTSEVVRLDASGNQIQTYSLPGTSLLFAVNLDPDGTSFWTADLFSGEVFKVDIASGSILQQWSSAGAAGFTAAAGLSVKGEIVVGGNCVSFSPSTIDFGNVKLNTTKKKVLTLTNNCTAKVVIGAVSFTNVTGDPADFSAHEYCNQPSGVLLVGHSCKIGVFFSADEVDTDTATLNVAISAPGSAIQVPVTATEK
jgi:streptogramin lyase